MFHVVLFEPEIPPNTGNLIRLCANAGAALHLIHPLGFELDEKRLRRAGLDYKQWACINEHDNLAACQAALKDHRWFAIETCGSACYADVQFQDGDVFMFGPESRGLKQEQLANIEPDNILVVPMKAHTRSINLCNTVSIVLFEAWRQNGFADACAPYNV